MSKQQRSQMALEKKKELQEENVKKKQMERQQDFIAPVETTKAPEEIPVQTLDELRAKLAKKADKKRKRHEAEDASTFLA